LPYIGNATELTLCRADAWPLNVEAGQDKRMKVSIIVPFYQAEDTIRRCIESLLAQDWPRDDVEILMVDNNSTDRSAAIASEFPEVTLLDESKQGAYAARNRALAQARGEVIAFTDPDCVARPDWLLRLTGALASPEVVIVVGCARLNGASVPIGTLQDYEMSKDEQLLNGDDPLVYFGRTNNMAVRRRVFDAIGPFEERQRGADTILVRRCVDLFSCEAVRYLPSAEVLHLEVDDLWIYYRKVYTYGRSLTAFASDVPAAVVDRGRRWTIYRKTCRDHAYSGPRSALLLLLLGIEGIAWKLGSLSASAQRARTARAVRRQR
jgi:glycosyltransferase involved in cell wall biosynthesis